MLAPSKAPSRSQGRPLVPRGPEQEMTPELAEQLARRRELRLKEEAKAKSRLVERDVYLPFSLSVASLARLVGRRLTTVQRVIARAGLPHNEAVHRALRLLARMSSAFPREADPFSTAGRASQSSTQRTPL